MRKSAQPRLATPRVQGPAWVPIWAITFPITLAASGCAVSGTPGRTGEATKGEEPAATWTRTPQPGQFTSLPAVQSAQDNTFPQPGHLNWIMPHPLGSTFQSRSRFNGENANAIPTKKERRKPSAAFDASTKRHGKTALSPTPLCGARVQALPFPFKSRLAQVGRLSKGSSLTLARRIKLSNCGS